MARPAIRFDDQIVEVGIRSSPPRWNVIIDFDAAHISNSFGVRAVDEVRDGRRRWISCQDKLVQLAKCLLLSVQIKVKIVADRKSTRLNSSHRCISYAVFCLKKKR